MIKLSPGMLRLAKCMVPLVGLVPVAFGISVGLEKLAPERAEAALSEAPPIRSPAQPGSYVGTSAPRLALIVGNADYPDASAPLAHPIRDARALADELRHSGFEVEVQENLGWDEMKRAFASFNGRIKPGSVALVAYAGFGIQVGRQSYMIPVNAQIWKEADVRRDGISIDSVLADMHKSGASVKVAILDASRRNPFERRFRGYSAGLAAIDAPQGTLFMSAAAPGKVAYDAEGPHGLLIGELLKEINAPGVSAEAAFNHTRIGVSRSSNGEQVPLVSSSLIENFAFVPAARRHAGTRQADALDSPGRSTPKAQGGEATLGQGTDAVEVPSRTTPASRVAETRPEKTLSTANASRYELASQPVERPAAKKTKAPRIVEEAKPPRRTLNDVSREIVRERPRANIRRGGWNSSSVHAERTWRVAAAYPQHSFSSPVLGVAY